jgi:16S rRNA (guanine527-N7)-methyltransferase
MLEPVSPDFVSLLQTWSEANRQLLDLNVPYSSRVESALQRFHASLQRANRQLNLTRLVELQDFLTFHILDAALLYAYLPPKLRERTQLSYLDIGSGCGVPGIPLHLFLSSSREISMRLCESKRKKARYLQSVIEELNLSQPPLVRAQRSEQLLTADEERAGYDLVTARAIAKPAATLAIALPFLAPGGFFAAQTSWEVSGDERWCRALADHSCVLSDVHRVVLAGKDRYIFFVQKEAT